MIILANPRSDWNVLRPLLFESIGQTLTMVLVTLVIGGFLGLILGVVLYGTRPGNLFENAVVYRILDIIVNIVRPIPFIIFSRSPSSWSARPSAPWPPSSRWW